MQTQLDTRFIQEIHEIDLAVAYLYSNIKKTPLLQNALDFATKAHEGQKRKSGEPYIIHPILVAGIVSYVAADESMAIAALLHDVVEDTIITIEEVTDTYGKDVALLVEGLTKIDLIRDAELIPSSSDEKLIVSALSFRKMLVASIEDVRILVVKLCDRLHNMLTLDALPQAKRRRIAEETLVVYGPIAHRLGISFLKNLLEDLSFSYLFEKQYHTINAYIQEHYRFIETKLEEFQQSVSKLLIQNGFCEDDFEIIGRIKHKYSIYLKMQRKGIGIDEVLDLLAVRILVQNPLECYKVLGIVHLHFKPLASRFKDYIAIAKENGYQTIHSSVFFNSAIFEVQIRTFEMHKTAEYGIAAHWKYKSDANEIRLDWLDNLQYKNESAEDFYELIKNDLYSEDISVFSPKGDAFTLPRGAVVLDFAYAVHTEVGNQAHSCVVNKEKTSLLTELQNGDIVRIITSKEDITRCSWMDAVKTSRAKSNMKALCNAKIKYIDTLTSLNIVATVMDLNSSRVEEWFKKHNCNEKRLKISTDKNHLKEVVSKYITELSENKRFTRFLTRRRFKFKNYRFSGVKVITNKSVNGLVFDYCCHPKISDPVIGILDNAKVHVHHKLCENAFEQIQKNVPMVFVQWENANIYHYRIIVSLQSEKGALAKFLTYLAKLDIHIVSIELGKEKVEYTRYCEIEFHSTEANIYYLQGKIEKIVKLISIIRTDDAYRRD
jgi:GTP diphosphokinase / guanosine-3',5'-bis(diphosphate) 3'-diphosphatase